MFKLFTRKPDVYPQVLMDLAEVKAKLHQLELEQDTLRNKVLRKIQKTEEKEIDVKKTVGMPIKR